MKVIFSIALFIFPFLLSAQQGIVWGDELTVADGSVYGNIRPRLTTDANGNPIVLFSIGKIKIHLSKGNLES